MNGLEAFADAIMAFEGWKPGSVSNRNRNPGNLRKGVGEIGTDPNGYAIFASLTDGYAALKNDLAAKFQGRSHSALGPSSTLSEFFAVYAPAADHNEPDRYAQFVADHLTLALARPVSVNAALAEIWPGTTA